MKLLANIKTRSKLALMLFCPLVAVLYLSGVGVWEKWNQAREMESLLALSELAVRTSELVHESQKERGMTALFLGSKGTKFRAELSSQRAETDKQMAALKQYVSGFDRRRFGGEFTTSMNEALAGLEKTPTTRDAVTALNIAAPDALGHYTETIAALLRVISRAAHESGEGELTRRLTAYVSFLQAKERTGIERALLSNTFAQDRFGPGMYERVLATVTAQETYARVFESVASDADREFSRKTMTSPASEEVARMRKLALEKAATGKFGTDPAYWFKTMTDKINLMKQVEDRLSDGLVARAERLRSQAWSVLLVFLAIGAGAVALAIGIGIVCGRMITRPLKRVVEMLKDIAEGEGDLTKRVEVTSQDEIGEVAHWFNTFIGKIHDIMAQVKEAAGRAATASQELSAASEQLSSGAQEQASSLEETAASLEEITGTVKQNADNAKQANQLAMGSRDVAEKGGQVVTEAVHSMTKINQASKKIADIITTIDEIAFQTNLLALNAAVEAARAGEQGRGFAVVASEVRNLAQRSATAAKEIKGLIQDSVQKVEAGSELVNKSGETLNEIVASVKRVTDIIAEIAAASQEQTTGIDQVNKAVTQMDQVTQGNAAQTEELSSTAQSLAAQAEELQAVVGRFKLAAGGQGDSAPAGGAAPKPAAERPVAHDRRASDMKRGAVRKTDEVVLTSAGNGTRHHRDDGFDEF
jgi:methyl-accepting chemotaxis protein